MLDDVRTPNLPPDFFLFFSEAGLAFPFFLCYN